MEVITKLKQRYYHHFSDHSEVVLNQFVDHYLSPVHTTHVRIRVVCTSDTSVTLKVSNRSLVGTLYRSLGSLVSQTFSSVYR